MEKKTYIDLFAGCGGLSLGLYNSGKWKGQFAIEKNADAFETLKHNLISNNSHFNWPKWLPKNELDINKVIKNHSEELLKLRGTIDMVAGGPPCQGFSTAGKRKETDQRNKLIGSYIKFIRLVQPKVIFFENVKGFTQKFDKNKKRGKVYSEYVKRALQRPSESLDSIGYKVYGRLVDFSEFGVPQKRTRFILVGIRKDIGKSIHPEDFFKSIFDNRKQFLTNKGLAITTTLEAAISDLQKKDTLISKDSPSFTTSSYGVVSDPYQSNMRCSNVDQIPDSHRFANHTPRTLKKFEYILAHAEKGKTLSADIKSVFNLRKRTIIPVDPSKPAPTLTTLPDDYIHYSEPRIFTVREYARIQSFNDWYQIRGKYTTGGKRRVLEVPRYSQIGNAIPPLFAEQAGESLSKLITTTNKSSLKGIPSEI